MILKPSYSPSISLQTARLNLRPHEPNDLEDSYALWSDPNTTTFIGGRPFTREECWSRILRYIGLWPALGYGYWAMFEKDGGRFVGEVGFADFRRDLKPPLDGPEAGWAIMLSISTEWGPWIGAQKGPLRRAQWSALAGRSWSGLRSPSER